MRNIRDFNSFINEANDEGLSKDMLFESKVTPEDMLKREEIIDELIMHYGDDYDDTIEYYFSKSKNHKKNIYYWYDENSNIYDKSDLSGIYLGKDFDALNSFYDEPNTTITKMKGNPKWLDLILDDDFIKFQKKYLKGIKLNDPKIGKVINKMGYDGIRYYNAVTTGEEFVLFNTDVLKQI